MEEKDKIIVKWAQEDVETSNSLLNNNNNNNNNNIVYSLTQLPHILLFTEHNGNVTPDNLSLPGAHALSSIRERVTPSHLAWCTATKFALHVSAHAPSVLCIACSVITSQVRHTVGTLPPQRRSSM